MDIEKALLDQNLVLGRIEEMCKSTQNLQLLANGRTSKLEERVNSLEEANNRKIGDLETAKNIMDGRLQGMKWIWGIAIAIVAIAEPLVLHYWK